MINLFFLFVTFLSIAITAQQTAVTGTVKSTAGNLLDGASVYIQNNLDTTTYTNAEGNFTLKENLPVGEQILVIEHQNYKTRKFPITINTSQTLHVGMVTLELDFTEAESNFATIDLNELEGSLDEDFAPNQTLLQAGRDVFLSSAAFDWRSTFFNVRGLSSKYARVVLNGVTMNSVLTGRPNWSNWSGLNDLYRSQEVTNYGQGHSLAFGNLVGVNQLNYDASKYQKGYKVSFSTSNRTHQNRVIATLHSGIKSNGFAYTFSASRASASQGYVQGTAIKNFSIAASTSYQFNARHRVNFTALLASVNRARSSPNTKEVIEIKGQKYNSYWGYQNGKKRNSRIQKIQEPIFTLNHHWEVNSKWHINTNAMLQIGRQSASRLDFNGRSLDESNSENVVFSGVSRNPDPTYYQRLPSYFLSNNPPDYERAFLANRAFKNNGQLDWQDIYQRNATASLANYAVYEDVIRNQSFTLNTLFQYEYSPNVYFSGKFESQTLNSGQFAEVSDLLGAEGYLDIDAFSEGARAQNNLKTPNRIVVEGDKFKYHFNYKAQLYHSQLQTEISLPKCELFAGVYLNSTQYERIGKFENGNYPGAQSIGKSKSLNFHGYGIKGGATYQYNNKWYLSGSINYLSSPPTLRQSYSNPRQNNDVVQNLANEQQTMLDASLNYQYGKYQARLSGYYVNRSNVTNVSFFFTEQIAALTRENNAAFVQEITTGANLVNTGLELGVEREVVSGLNLQIAAAYGNHYYANNPNLYLTSDSFDGPLNIGKSYLKNYKQATGPQQVYGFGFNYSDPKYWWFATQLNYYLNSYINISPFTRTDNFTQDIDGNPLNNYDASRARELLAQEDFGGYFLWNAVGGKSWRIKHGMYLGVTIGVQNVLNQSFFTGGFEQSRNANYSSLNEDKSREYPLFGNKYWQGTGTTFFINSFWRF